MGDGRKAIFLDLDGTLSYKGAPPCAEDIAALRAVRDAGHFVLLNTGRSSGFVPEELKQVDYLDGMLCGCGTQLIIHGHTIFTSELSRPFLRRTAAFFLEHPGRRCQLEAEANMYIINGDSRRSKWPQVSREDDFETVFADAHVVKLTIIGAITNEERALFGNDMEIVPQNDGSLYEVILPGMDKGRGLIRACKYLGVEVENSIAIGDSDNDLAMLESAGTAVAMSNSSGKIREAADYITGYCSNGGVAQAMKVLVLGNRQGAASK